MLITRTSQVSGVTHTRDIDVSEEQMEAWIDGIHIQKVMPELSPNDREFILTGITPEEWDTIFPEEDEL